MFFMAEVPDLATEISNALDNLMKPKETITDEPEVTPSFHGLAVDDLLLDSEDISGKIEEPPQPDGHLRYVPEGSGDISEKIEEVGALDCSELLPPPLPPPCEEDDDEPSLMPPLAPHEDDDLDLEHPKNLIDMHESMAASRAEFAAEQKAEQEKKNKQIDSLWSFDEELEEHAGLRSLSDLYLLFWN